MRQIAGVLLTGGASTRMGIDKARLVVNGESLAARAARVLSAACDPVIEVGPSVSGLPAVQEDPPGAGPLVALLAGVGALGNPRVVVLLACDLPFVEAPLLQLLVEWPGNGTVIPCALNSRQIFRLMLERRSSRPFSGSLTQNASSRLMPLSPKPVRKACGGGFTNTRFSDPAICSSISITRSGSSA